MNDLLTTLVTTVTAIDRNQHAYIPPDVARILFRTGFVPHRSYLRAPPPAPRARCSGLTHRGTQCVNKCALNLTTCMIHSATPTERPIPSLEYRCTANTKNGELCKNGRFSIYPMCMLHARKANLLPPPPEVPTECAICYNDLSDGTKVKTSCGHYFHGQCFAVWKTVRTREGRSVTCPMCRHACPNARDII